MQSRWEPCVIALIMSSSTVGAPISEDRLITRTLPWVVKVCQSTVCRERDAQEVFRGGEALPRRHQYEVIDRAWTEQIEDQLEEPCRSKLLDPTLLLWK